MRPYLREVAGGVHAYVQPDGGWCVSNAVVLTGGAGPVLIDTAATEARARGLRAAVATLTPDPVRVLVNTHHHGDHTFGNGLFPEAVVVAHDLARAEMAAKGGALRAVWPEVDWGEVPPVLPGVTFADRLTLHLGRTVELLHVGPAHTTDDVVAWLPDTRVLVAGDVVLSGCTPFVLMGSLDGTLAAIRRLRALEPVAVVCGHGPVCGPEVFDVAEDYLLWVRDLAAKGVEAGLSPLELAGRYGPGRFGDLRDPERLVANLHRAYQEAAGGQRGAYLPSAPVFAEMVTLNGGPLTCHA